MELMIIDERNVLDQDFRVYGTVENPLFLAKDVAVWIDYAKTGNGKYDVSKMLRSVDDDEKGTNIVRTPGGTQSMWFLTEDGLYEVLMQSRKPIAKQFKKEVKKILKEIRLTGAYISPEAKKEYFDRMVDMLQPDTLKQVAKETYVFAQQKDAECREIASECQDLKAEGAVRASEIKLLKHEELTWADRDFIIAAVKVLAYKAYWRVGNPTIQIKYAWGAFYKELAYRYHISVRHRRIDQVTGKRMKSDSPRMNVLRDDEVPKAVATIVALCNEKGVSLSDMIRRLSDPSIAYDLYYVDPHPMRVYRMDDGSEPDADMSPALLPN